MLELLKQKRSVERVLIAKEVAPSQILGVIRRRAEEASVPIRVVPRSEVDRITGGVNHQGVAAVAGRYRYTPLEVLLRAESPALLFLDHVTDPHNLGSLLRSADGAGFTGVVLPARRSAGVTVTVRRVSAGAAEVMPAARVANLGAAIEDAKTAGLWIVGLDEKAPDDLWTSELVAPPVGLVLGAEDRGISRPVRDRCDALVSIPTRGKLGSLNVAVAGAVAMFEVARRMTGSPP